MEIQDIAALAEIIGVLLIVISFAFLALQIRGSNKATIANLSQTISDSEMNVSVQLLKYADIWQQMLDDSPIEAAIERRRAIILMNHYFVHTENRFNQYQLGYLDNQTWQDSISGVRMLVNLSVYEQWKHAPSYYNRSQKFRRFLEDLRV
jgi:hypothetical protein